MNSVYPFSDLIEQTENTPLDVIRDLSMSCAVGSSPHVTILKVISGTLYLAIEDSISGEFLGDVFIPSVSGLTSYNISTEDGTGVGTILTGSNVFSDYALETSLDISSRCISYYLPDEITYTKVNGVVRGVKDYVELTSGGILTLTSSGQDILLKRSIPGSSAYLDRDLSTSKPNGIYSLGGAVPDSEGNVDIIVEGCLEDCRAANDLRVLRAADADHTLGFAALDIYSEKSSTPLPGACDAPTSTPIVSVEEPICTNTYPHKLVDERGGHIGIVFNHDDTSDDIG